MSARTAASKHDPDRQRRRRADYGSVRLSDRDVRLLALIGAQYAITVEQLARLIGRRERTARWLRDRWRQAGWIESRQLLAAGPSLVWLTGTGARVAGSPYRTWRPNPGLAAHIEAVTEVRLLLDQQLRLGSWRCERELAKALLAEGRPHLPDAVIETGDETVAVEVELTLKSRARLEAVLEELGRSYDQVWYFAPPKLQPTLRSLAAAAPWQNISVYTYPPRLSELA